VFQSTRLFNHKYFIIARVAYACRVQSLWRPDAAEKGNNVALIVLHGVFEGSAATPASDLRLFHGPFEGSSAIAASEGVILIQ
jgi:hypothetical protein